MSSTTLRVDATAKADLARILATLRSARQAAQLSQAQVADGLPVHAHAVCEWECGIYQPPLDNLILWTDRLKHRLVLLDRVGRVVHGPTRQRAGEVWVHFERRRLASPLRYRRAALKLSQLQLAKLVGVSRDSIGRWENATVPPRPIAHIVWAQTLGYTLALQPIDPKKRQAQAVALQEQGHIERTIAQDLGVTPTTIRRYLTAPTRH